MNPMNMLMMGPLGGLLPEGIGLNPFANAGALMSLSPGAQMLAKSPIGESLNLPEFMKGQSDFQQQNPMSLLMEKMAKRQTGNFQI